MGEHQPADRDDAEQATEASPEAPPSRSANQVQDEPLPASHDEPRRQAAVVTNEEGSAAGAAQQGRGSRSSPDQPAGDASSGR
ncbi:MAG TPA: hypothetical protein VIJ82_14745 [Streptosporangiaceae bacterium]|jgi:hypothetical protein